jgi:hypothetical protein
MIIERLNIGPEFFAGRSAEIDTETVIEPPAD